MKVWYLPLEPYEQRYTAQLLKWTTARFDKRGIEYEVIEGDTMGNDIATGVALDAHGRPYYALTQTANFIKAIKAGCVRDGDVIYNQDLFHPGWESLPYIFHQMGLSVRLYTHLLAQTIDPNDFTFSMRGWMRHYEMMVDKTSAAIFVAAHCMVEMMQAAMFEASIFNVGLLYDKEEVRARAEIKPWHERRKRVVFASRWDAEKQPFFFLEVVRRAQERMPDYEFCICTSATTLRSNDKNALIAARGAAQRGAIKIYEGLSKDEYYAILADSRIHFNCAKQDFISNTLNEASALGTPSVLPAFLSFPEAVNNDERFLYAPWSIESAIDRLIQTSINPPLDKVSYSADYHHATLDRVIDHFEGEL